MKTMYAAKFSDGKSKTRTSDRVYMAAWGIMEDGKLTKTTGFAADRKSAESAGTTMLRRFTREHYLTSRDPYTQRHYRENKAAIDAEIAEKKQRFTLEVVSTYIV